VQSPERCPGRPIAAPGRTCDLGPWLL
jgi:hypothetical protein